MSNDEMAKTWIPHLRGQFERARPILFTGAGFSVGTRNVAGAPLPSLESLRGQLWTLCFPGTAYEEGNSLQDLYEHAALRHRRELAELLQRQLTVDAESVAEWYSHIFSLPWQRIYTLNIDDLPTAASRKYELPRVIVPISATNPTKVGVRDFAEEVELVYLNGNLDDVPDHVTFSVTQYAERLARPDPWYIRFSADLLTNPVVFIGTRLDEPPMWQHVTMRHGPGSREMRELRQRSYLVTPTLDKARAALLAEFNVVWVPMTAEQFSERVLGQMGEAANVGRNFLATKPTNDGQGQAVLKEVTELAGNPSQQNEFLLGEEPVWADLQSGRAIAREVDEALQRTVHNATRDEPKPRAIVITGTAGSGKSTSLMRACLLLSGEGRRVGWVGRESDLTPGAIRSAMRSNDPPAMLAIDDADIYGTELSPLVRDVVLRKPHPLVLLGIRSGRVDHVLNPVVMEGIQTLEFPMPPLADSDISSLVRLLEREKRLGILTGRPRAEQEAAFRGQAGRQLLVAMLQATSGRRFEEKAFEEFGELPGDSQVVYAITALASAYRFGLGKDEILIASGNRSNVALNCVEQLVKRHVITMRPDGQIWARHRVIAEIVRDQLAKRGQLTLPISGLALLAASKVTATLSRSARPWRMLRVFINHEFLLRHGGDEFARNLYGTLQEPLTWDYHFWLQRGSLEVEHGDLAMAEHYLNTARALAPEDPYVDNEYAYLLFRKAIDNPAAGEAADLVQEATDSLEYLITKIATPYPYHVLGTQGLAWARRGIPSSQERGRFLQKLTARLEEGCAKYPKALELKQILEAVKREYFNLAIPQRA